MAISIANPISGVTSVINGALSPASKATNSRNPILVFPRELRASTASYPCVHFSVAQRSNANEKATYKHIFLPMPPAGIEFNEGGEYGTIELGIIAAAGGMDALNKMMESPSASNLFSGIKNTGTNVFNQIKSLTSGQVGVIGGKMLGYGEGAQFAGKRIMTPNTNTTFKGNSIRSFTFNFKLVGRDKKDSEAIRNIHNLFRECVYADGDDTANIILAYPPVWKIQFIDGAKENPYIPKIFGCYLTSCRVMFNSGANIYRSDGAPIDVDITLSFQETRMLTQRDIKELSAGSMANTNRGIGENGLAESSVSDVAKNIDIQSTADAKKNAEQGGTATTKGSMLAGGLSDGVNGKPFGSSMP